MNAIITSTYVLKIRQENGKPLVRFLIIQLLRCKEMVLQSALIAYHNIEFIEVTVNETVFCQTNNKTNDPFKNHLKIWQMLNMCTALDRNN